MPDYKPNYFVRAFARARADRGPDPGRHGGRDQSSGGSDDGDNGKGGKADVSKVGRKAVRKGVWIVHSGDTLGEISVKTGIDQDTLLQLNPDLDPQALLEGQRIALR